MVINLYYFYRYYPKKSLLRNILKNYFREEDFIFLIKQYEEIRKNLDFKSTLLIVDLTNLELIQRQVTEKVVYLLQQYNRENYLACIFIMPFSLIAKYQFERILDKAKIECIKVKNRKEAILEINNYRDKYYFSCI
jgi:flagellar assembly factor FliW